jgi:poly(3-hydroxybutyrate) depolymerase
VFTTAVLVALVVAAGSPTKSEADALRAKAWSDHVAAVKEERAKELESKAITVGSATMKFFAKTFGDAPAGGRSLFISMHGGGGAPTRVNDQQWENQKRLYEPKEGVYVAPRAPGDTWDLWHEGRIDGLFDRLIEDLVIVEGVNPDRVYIMGYSAGGDGVFQLAPRMADRFAAAAMMAGHPNETKPDGLRNLPFTLHMGGNDGAFKRNEVAAQWKTLLADLHAADPKGYVNEVVIHQGKGHWMDREDAVAVPWMATHTRDLRPTRIVWLQDDVTHPRFYWLAVDEPKARERIVVERDGQTIRVLEAPPEKRLRIRLDDAMLDLDRPVVVLQGEKELFRGNVERSSAVIETTLKERGDRQGIWTAELAVTTLPSAP